MLPAISNFLRLADRPGIVFRGLVLILVSGLLAACAGKPPLPVGDTEKLARWQMHRDQLEQIQGWQVKGRIGLKAGPDAFSASLDWRRDSADDFRFLLYGTLGKTYARIVAGTEGFVLTLPDDRVITDTDPERLLLRGLGWRLPVTAMQDWLKGLPTGVTLTPDQIDDAGHVTGFRTGAWTITYEDYRSFDGLALPGKIRITHPDIQLRLAIRVWQI